MKEMEPARAKALAHAKRLRWARRASQIAFLALLVALPTSGVFWIDPRAGAFVVWDRQIGFDDILIVFGFWLGVASLLVITYSVAGQVFCGWACPQGAGSEWANWLTKKLLGRKADVARMDGGAMEIAKRKRAWWRWVVLGVALLAGAMLAALVPLIYFLPPGSLWAILGLTEKPLPPSTHWIYAVLVAVMFLDLAVIRHLFCKYMCIYRVWQHMFKTRETLHVAYDTARASECVHCRYCEEACFLELDPKRTFEYDSCINCGECIAACEELHAKSRKYAPPGLLRFALGPDPRAQTDGRLRAASLRGRIKAALIGAAAGFALFAVGLAGYAPHQLIVDHAEAQAGMLSDYRVMVRHKLYRPARFELSVAGLDPRWWRLDATTLTLSTAGRAETRLHLSPAMPKGLHRIVVRAQADDGWSGEFVIMHYAGGGDGRAQGSHAGQNRVGQNP